MWRMISSHKQDISAGGQDGPTSSTSVGAADDADVRRQFKPNDSADWDIKHVIRKMKTCKRQRDKRTQTISKEKFEEHFSPT